MTKKRLYLKFGLALILSLFFFLQFVGISSVISFTQLKSISDTVSTSHPEAEASHRVRFTLTRDIPGSSRIVFTPSYSPESYFYISSAMSYLDVDFFVNGEEIPTGSSAQEGVVGIDVTPGSQGNVTFNLHETQTLQDGDVVVLYIGKENKITNPQEKRFHWVQIDVFDSSDSLLSMGEAGAFILAPVQVKAGVFIAEPIVRTVPTETVGAEVATIRGELLNLGPAEYVDVFFQYRIKETEDWSETGKFGRRRIVAFSEFIGGLEKGTEYEYRAGVEWEDEEEEEEEDKIKQAFGEILEFTTLEDEPDEEDLGGVPGEGGGTGGGATPGPGGSAPGQGGPGGPDDGIRDGEPADPPPPAIQDPPPYLGLQGWAYPQGSVVLLRDGEELRRASTDSSGEFNIEINQPMEGSFSFLLKAQGAEDENLSSTDISFNLEMNPSRGVIIRNIMFSPITQISKEFFLTEESVDISGRGIPNNEVNIQILKNDDVVVRETTSTTANGEWSFSLEPGSLDRGRYVIRTRSLAFDEESAFGGFLVFGISETGCNVADIVNDGRVGLSDFSVLMHYWNTRETRADLNNDGVVDLLDFSIMMNCWTG